MVALLALARPFPAVVINGIKAGTTVPAFSCTAAARAVAPPARHGYGFTAGTAFFAAGGATDASSFSFEKIPSPIPFTFFKSSTVLN